jgi:hypothetical protein
MIEEIGEEVLKRMPRTFQIFYKFYCEEAKEAEQRLRKENKNSPKKEERRIR